MKFKRDQVILKVNVDPEAPKLASGFILPDLDGQFMELNTMEQVRQAVASMGAGSGLFYFTKGAWSNHDLIEQLVSLTGPAKLCLTTWGIGEEAFRKIHHLQTIGQVTELTCLFDHRISLDKGKELQFVKGIANRIIYMKNHSKVVSIITETDGFVIYSSANLTRNPRMEAGVIYRGLSVAAFTEQFIQAQCDDEG